MKSLNLTLKSLFSLILFTLLVSAWVLPAAAAGPDGQERDGQEKRGARLEYALKLALMRVDALQDRIDNISGLADLAAEFIADEQEAGHDTTALEEALDAFRAGIAEAQNFHDEAAQILDEKAGFDEEGKVVEPEQARDTLKAAHQSMLDSVTTLRRARQDLRQALHRYKQSKRDN
jgi:hypothetical protein